MKSYRLETENGIEYVVINLSITEIKDWRKYVMENYNFLKKPDFKFIIDDGCWVGLNNFVFYTKKYKFHNLYGPSVKTGDDVPQFWLDGIQYKTEEEYINEVRSRILGDVLKNESIEE
jgi:hypothetical protein